MTSNFVPKLTHIRLYRMFNKGVIKLQENIKAEEINKKTFKRVNLKEAVENKKP